MTLEDVEETWQNHLGIQQHGDSDLAVGQSRSLGMELPVFLRAFDHLAVVKYASSDTDQVTDGGAGHFNRLLLRDVFRDVSTCNVGFVAQ